MQAAHETDVQAVSVMVVDITTTLVIAIYLRKLRTGWRGTDTIIRRLMM